jgi:hypothetical protein
MESHKLFALAGLEPNPLLSISASQVARITVNTSNCLHSSQTHPSPGVNIKPPTCLKEKGKEKKT